MRGSVRGDGNVLNLDLVVIIQSFIFVKTQSDHTIRKNKFYVNCISINPT